MRVGRVLGAVVLPPLLLLTAACNGSSKPADPQTSPAAATSSTTAKPGNGTTAAPVADPAHAVDAPGPRKGKLTYADMLVYNPDSLTDEEVAAIRRLKGVQSVNSLALANVSIENKVINVAAVDPSTYRNFTLAASAETQAVWDRVAGGELAIDPELRKKIPADKDGYLRLGSDKNAPEVHVGAFAPQIPQVDAIVNRSWIDTLHMKDGNGLILNTGGQSPQSLRKAVEKIAGDNASVQILGPDLDTSVKQTAFLVGSIAQAVGTFNYTVLGGGHIAPEQSWVDSHIATQQVPILGSVTCNKLIFPQLTAALNEIISRGLADKIHPGEYAGCYYPRFIAGTTSLSNHSFGLALDLNVPGNQRGTVGEMDRDVVTIFKEWGFAWGGDWHYTDPMHFEANALVDPH
jgi:hypothetical protein